MKKIGKIKLYTAIVLIFILATALSAALYISITGYGVAMPSKPYDKHLANYDTNETNSYESDLRFIYDEIKDNYIYLEYKEDLFNFDWDELYNKYEAQIPSVKK